MDDYPGAISAQAGSLALAPLVAILVFFNLYVVHTYYLIACAPFLALFTGVGLSLVFGLARTRFIRLIFLLLLIGIGLQEWSGRLGAAMGAPAAMDRSVQCLSEVARFIRKDESVIVLSSSEWSAFAPYYLKRRAFMPMLLNKPVNIQPLLDQNYFKKCGFHWLLIEGNDGRMAGFTAQITNQWKIARPVPLTFTHAAYALYSLTDE